MAEGAARGWERAIDLARLSGAGAHAAIAARLVGTERFWGREPDRIFPAASTIKVAVLAAVARAVDAGRVSFDDVARVQSHQVAGGSGVLASMRPDLALSLRDFAYLMIAVSDNTATNALIDAIGIGAVQATIRSLGMRQTGLNRRFLGHSPGAGEPENYTSAGDLVNLLTAIALDRAASPARCAEMRALLALQQDRDRLARRLPAGISFGGKSGSLPGLIHDCGLIGTPAGTLAIAVLTWGIADPYAAEETIGRIALAMVDEVTGG